MHKLKWFQVVIALIIGVVFSASEKMSANELSFGVQIETSEYQRHATAGYFDLILVPGQKTQVRVQLTNPTDRRVKVGVRTATATTNANGVVDYETSQDEKWARLVQVADTVTLQPKSSQFVSITIEMPGTAFPGVKAGGLTFYELANDQQRNPAGMQIKQEYSYTVALLVRNNEKHVAAHMREDGMTLKRRDGQTDVVLRLRNQSPIFHQGMTIQTRIYRGKQLVMSETRRDLQFAPSSRYDHRTSVRQLQPGYYRVETQVTTDKGRWTFTNRVRVNAMAAITSQKDVVNHWPIWLKFALIIIGGLLAFIGWLLWLLIRRQKQTKQQ